jgi:hypothetical protein
MEDPALLFPGAATAPMLIKKPSILGALHFTSGFKIF